MKKISVLALILIIGFMFNITTKAVTDTPNVTIVNYYSTTYGVEFDYDIELDSVTITFDIAGSDFHTDYIGGIYSEVLFFTPTGTQITSATQDIHKYKGLDLSGKYYIDLVALGLYEQVGNITIRIMQTFTSTPSGYYNYLLTNSFVEVSKDINQREIFWLNINTFSTQQALFTTLTLPKDVYEVSIYIPQTDFNITTLGGVESVFSFYDSSNTLLTTIDLKDIEANFVSGFINFNFYQYGLEDYIGDIYKITFLLNQTYINIPAGYIEYFNENTIFLINESVKFYSVYVDDEFYLRSFYIDNTLNEIEAPTIAGKKFLGWFLPSGEEFNFNNITPSMLVNGELIIFGKYQVVVDFNFDAETPTPDNENQFVALLGLINFNTPFGFILVFMAILIGVLFLVKKYTNSNIMFAIIIIALLTIFMFLGILPIIFTLIAILVTGLIIIYGLGDKLV